MKTSLSPLRPMSELLREARRGSYAVPGFCVWNAETMAAVLAVAQAERAPAILMCGPAEFSLLSPRLLADVARQLARQIDVPVVLHLDHGDSLARCRECLEAGFSSVMIDASMRPLAANVAMTRQVIEWARPFGASVEGEVGVLGRVDSSTVEGGSPADLTDPAEAVAFVEQTGVDAVAVAIGNAHGIYPGRPQFDFARLEEIAARVSVPLVLHGGSGTPETDLQRAIRTGICKVNVASELVRAFWQALQQAWTDAARPPWPPVAEREAMAGIQTVVRRWLRCTGAAGRA